MSSSLDSLTSLVATHPNFLYRNDTLLQENDPVRRHRLEVNSTHDNSIVRTSLTIHSVKATDLTMYKLNARNKQGQVTWKFRVAMLPDHKVMPKIPPSLDYSKEKNPVTLNTELHAFENVSTPQVILKGAFTNVLRSGDFTYKVCSENEFGLIKGLVNNHVLAGGYDAAIQVGVGVALKYDRVGVLTPLLEHVVGLGEYTENTIVKLMEGVLHGLSFLHWSNVGVVGLGAGSVVVDGSGVVKIVDLSGGQRINRVGVESELVHGKGGRLNLNADLEYVGECIDWRL